MQYKSIDGKTYTLNTKKYIKKSKNCSKYHKAARELIKDLFPTFVLLEEIRLHGTKMTGMSDLYADFFILNCTTLIEVHGRQHYEYIPHFHKSKAGFLRHKKRDKIKKEWCEINGFNFIELKYNEDLNDWRERIAHTICE